MANLGMNFDSRNVEPSTEMGPIPPDWYPVTITASEMKQTSKKTGSYLEVEYTVLNGKFKGRKIFENLNLNNPNATAVEIAYAQLSAICHATNVLQVQDSSQLHNIPFDLKVGIQPAGKGTDNKEYPARNEVLGYRKLEGTGAPVGGAPTGGGSPDWANNNAAAPMNNTAPAVNAAPAPTPAAPAPVQYQQVEVYTQKFKDTNATLEQFLGNGWTKEAMVEQGYIEIQQVAVAPAVNAAPAPAPTGAPPWQANNAAANAATPAQNLAQPSPSSTNAAPPWQQ